MTDIVFVQNLNAYGEGSLRDAVENHSDRVVIIPDSLNGTIDITWSWSSERPTGGQILVTGDNITILCQGDVAIKNYGIAQVGSIKNLSIYGLKFHDIKHETQRRFPISFWGDGLVVDHCEFAGCSDNISLYDGAASGAKHVVFKNCTFAYPVRGNASQPRQQILCLNSTDITFYRCVFVGGEIRNPRFGATDISTVHSLKLLNCVWFNCARMFEIVTTDNSQLRVDVVNCRFIRGTMADPYPTNPYIPINMEPINTISLDMHIDGNVIEGYDTLINPNITYTPVAAGCYDGFNIVPAAEIDIASIGLPGIVRDIILADLPKFRAIDDLSELVA